MLIQESVSELSYHRNHSSISYQRENTGVFNGIRNLSRWHLIGILICAVLLMGDFLTTSIALSMGTITTDNGEVSMSEGNPLMQAIVNNTIAFAALKIAILGMVIASAYILKDNGFMAYCPYVIVGSMYAFVVANNLNILLYAL